MESGKQNERNRRRESFAMPPVSGAGRTELEVESRSLSECPDEWHGPPTYTQPARSPAPKWYQSLRRLGASAARRHCRERVRRARPRPDNVPADCDACKPTARTVRAPVPPAVRVRSR